MYSNMNRTFGSKFICSRQDGSASSLWFLSCRLVFYRIQLDLFLLVEPCQVQGRVRSSHWSNKPDFGFGSYPEELKKPVVREVKHPVSYDTALIITVTWTIQNLHQHVNYNKNPPNTHCQRASVHVGRGIIGAVTASFKRLRFYF